MINERGEFFNQVRADENFQNYLDLLEKKIDEMTHVQLPDISTFTMQLNKLQNQYKVSGEMKRKMSEKFN